MVTILPVLGGEQIGQCGLAAMEDAVEIDAHHPPPALRRQLGEGRAFRRAGIVDQDRDRPLQLPRAREGAIDLGAIGDVGHLEKADAGADDLQRLAAAPDQGDARALGGQRLRDGGADAGAAAGDDGVMSAQSHALSSASRARLRASCAMPPR